MCARGIGHCRNPQPPKSHDGIQGAEAAQNEATVPNVYTVGEKG
jgi:hypothetical protein